MSDGKPAIIFLDLDGVLNNYVGGPSTIPADTPDFCRENIAPFNSIIRATNARIVLTSNWRYYITNGHFSLSGFRVLLRSHGVLGELIDHTREDRDDEEDRWLQIRDWQKCNPGHHRYCILDDRAHAFGGRPGVQTNGAVGLTWHDAKSAIEILTAPSQL